MVQYHIPSLDQLPAIAKQFWREYQSYTVFLLTGDLGAGKTTFVQAIGKQLQIADDVLSPTYTIVNEYETKDGLTVYHADLYRLHSMEEAQEVGIEEYLDSGHPCFIEWPELIEPLLPLKFVKLELKNHPDGDGRLLIVDAYG